ncbi:MAG: hypothetical protein WAZ77_00710 [Candidatus Nitrosopolaris sp.]
MSQVIITLYCRLGGNKGTILTWVRLDTAEFSDESIWNLMTKGHMSRATPEKFQFSIKVPETVTHLKRLYIKKNHDVFRGISG